MKKISETIVFFGSGPVAASSLKLLSGIFDIEAVVTKPRLEHHRGDVPVISIAEELGLNIETVASRKALDALIDKKPFKSKLGILIDFGIIVSQRVIHSFPLGIINSHFSLLPEWRGADPITFSILSGQKKTGVSLMLITARMDEGPVLGQAVYELSPEITTPELTEELIQISHSLLTELVPMYVEGITIPAPQSAVTLSPSKAPSYSRKLTKEDGLIDWQKPAEQIEREIRAFIEWPKSRTTLAEKDVVITSAHVVPGEGTPGVAKTTRKELLIHTGKGTLSIDTLKPAGKKEMTVVAFLAGYGHLFS